MTLVLLIGLVLLVGSIPYAITFGPSDLSIGEVWEVVANKLGLGSDSELSPLRTATVRQLRLPRVLLAVVAGAGLSLCGVIMQSLLRNPLAESYLLGASSGASTGAVLVLITGLGGGVISFLAGAFAGSLGASALIPPLSRSAGGATDKTVLAGIVVTQRFSTLTSFIIMIGADANVTRGILYWLMGFSANVSWKEVAPTVTVSGYFLVPAIGMASSMDAFMLGEKEAVPLGVSVQRTRVVLLGCVALMTAVMVSSSGSIGFVGLMLPHIPRTLAGSRHRGLLPVPALLGVILLLWADTIAWTLFAPLETPVGAITILVGVPISATIFARTRKR